MIPSVAATQLRSGVEDFLRSTFPVSTPKLHRLLDPLFERERGMVKGPYLSIDLPFEPSEIEGEPFPEILLGFRPHRHQERAFRRLSGPVPRSTLVATGTGSGKTESFLWPILDHCRRHAGQPGIKALIIYPMNALATDQAKRIARTVAKTAALKGLVKAGLFVGESERDPYRTMGPDMVITDKDTLRDSPPDILLTNYKMLDYLLIRPRDQKLWRGTGPETLRFLVVDELHTFDGAQGTDLACLIRRLRDRLSVREGHLCCVGTSATLGSGADTAPLRTYAYQVFAAEFDAGSVITEERQSVGNYLEKVLTDPRGIPRPSDAAALRPEGYAGFEDYIRAQHRLWFDDEVPDDFADTAWTEELGARRLQPLPFFQNLLKVLAGRARSIDDVLDELRQRIRLPKPPPGDGEGRYHRDLIDSIVALTAVARQWREETPEDRARREAAGGPRLTRPFLNIRLQLWLRELRRMVADVTGKPALRFSDDLSEPELKVHLPVVNCLDCDSTGWSGLVREGESTVRPDLKDFYNAFFAESCDVTFFFPTDGNAGAALGMRAGVTPCCAAGACTLRPT
jgi:DEAD/DEAH box helicase domain-containing protein